MAKIELAEMIKELRRELLSAVEAGRDQEIRFELGEVTLDAEVEVTREASARGGLKFWLAEVTAGGGGSRAQTQKVVLKLLPRTADDGVVKLAR